MLNKKCEERVDENFFYAFIRLNEFKKLPDIWMVPSKVVAEFAKHSHKKWLNIPGRSSAKHQDNDMRAFFIEKTEICPDNWERELKKYMGNIALLDNI